MKTHYFIKNARKPTLPIQSTIVAYLVLDRFNVSLLVWGILGTIFAILWIILIAAVWTYEGVELIDSETGKVK